MVGPDPAYLAVGEEGEAIMKAEQAVDTYEAGVNQVDRALVDELVRPCSVAVL